MEPKTGADESSIADTDVTPHLSELNKSKRDYLGKKAKTVLHALDNCKGACVSTISLSKRGFVAVEDCPHKLTRVEEQHKEATIALLPGEDYPVSALESEAKNAADYLLKNPAAVGKAQSELHQLCQRTEEAKQWIHNHDGAVVDTPTVGSAKRAITTTHRYASVARYAMEDIAHEHPGIVRMSVEGTRSTIKNTLPHDTIQLSFATHEGDVFTVSSLERGRWSSGSDGRGFELKMKLESDPQTLYTIHIPPDTNERPTVIDENWCRDGENIKNSPLRSIIRTDRIIR